MGFAQKRYAVWKGVEEEGNSWPFSPIDQHLARELGEMYGVCGPYQELALGYLSAAARAGHLCVKTRGNILNPSLEELSEGGVDEKEILRGLGDLQGALVEEEGDAEIPQAPVIRREHCVYFQKYWVHEAKIRRELKRLQKEKPEYDIAYSPLDGLLPQQNQAVNLCSERCLTLIAGGPGTGKTHTAGEFLAMLLEEYPNVEVALAAPTGKAVSNLQGSLLRALERRGVSKEIQAKTLHSLLAVGGGRHRQWTPHPAPLAADVILVDESSMIDVQLMARLLASVKPGARLILLGDPHQLPPVEAGGIFADLMTICDGAVSLKTCLRAELQELVQFATAVNEGREKEVLEGLHRGTAVGVLGERDPWIWMAEQFSQEQERSPEELFAFFQEFRVLSPLRKGPWGVETVNRRLFELCRYRNQRNFQPIPIMITRNHPRLDLYNGDVGIWLRHSDSSKDSAWFGGGEGLRTFPMALLPPYEMAYCLSVHKSQGSEFGRVALLLPEGAEVFGRQVLYTAVTRAKRELRILGEESVLLKTLKGVQRRVSGMIC